MYHCVPANVTKVKDRAILPKYAKSLLMSLFSAMLVPNYERGRSAMNSRLSAKIIVGILIVVIITTSIALLVFPTQKLSEGLLYLAVGSVLLYGGIKKHRATKGKYISVLWWRSSLIIETLLQYCIVGLLVITGLANIIGEDKIGIILWVPIALLSIGLGIYVIYLSWQQIETKQISEQPPSDFQQLPPILQ